MAIKSVNDLKSFFETGDKPTQQQFWDWLESFFHKQEGIAISDVTNLQNTLNSKAEGSAINALTPILLDEGQSSIEIPAGKYINDIVVIAPTAIYITVGTTNSGTELSEVVSCNNDGTLLGIRKFFKQATTIYFGGVLSNTQIIIY
jgi:hypothetical protein